MNAEALCRRLGQWIAVALMALACCAANAQPAEPAVGEYACHGAAGRQTYAIAFRLKPGGTYEDLNGRKGGRYFYRAEADAVTFRGGFLEGQVGRSVRANGFQLSRVVSCSVQAGAASPAR